MGPTGVVRTHAWIAAIARTLQRFRDRSASAGNSPTGDERGDHERNDDRGAIDYKLSWMRGPCRDEESRMTGTRLTGVARVS